MAAFNQLNSDGFLFKLQARIKCRQDWKRWVGKEKLERLRNRRNRIVRGDKVYIRSGPHEGSTGTVLRVLRYREAVIVEGVNKRVSYSRRDASMPAKRRLFESPVHLSKVALIDPVTNKPSRIKWVRQQDGQVARVSVVSDSVIFPPPVDAQRSSASRWSSIPESMKCTKPEVALETTFKALTLDQVIEEERRKLQAKNPSIAT